MNKFFYTQLRNSIAIVAALLMGVTVSQAQTWCTPTYTTQCGGANSPYVNSFSTTGGINNITNNGTGCGNTTTSYSDYTTMKVTQNAGGSVTVTATLRNVPTYLTKAAVWVDWNRDGDFDDAQEEQQWSQIVTAGVNMTQSVTFTVPPTARHGVTRMRIRSVSNGASISNIAQPVPCGGVNIDEGEAEDYSFEVINPCLPPSVLSIANVDYKSAEVSWSRRGNARMYEYMISADPNFYPNSLGYYYIDTNTRFLALDNLICDTMYHVWVRSICDTSGITQNWDTSGWIEDSFKTDPCCYEPEPVIENITGTSAIARWAPVGSAYGYEYAISVLPTPPQNGTYTTYTSAFVQGLMSRTVYYLHVRSRCSPTPLSGWKTVVFQTGKSLSVNAVNGSNFIDVKAYPNPVKDQVTVNLTGTKAGNANIYLMDMSGKTISVVPVPASASEVNVDMATLPAGIYAIKYIDDAYNKVIKVNKL